MTLKTTFNIRRENVSKYINKVLSEVKAKNPDQPEFLQAVTEVLSTLAPVVDRNKEYERNAILERLVEQSASLPSASPGLTTRALSA